MAWENTTTVSHFVLLGLAKSWEVQVFLFLFFLLIYMATLFSNLLIISTILKNQRLLDSPMFFLLAHLSFLDICLPSFAIPNYLFGFLSQHQTISFNGCMTQIFWLHVFAGGEMLLLTTMAYDRYVAISHPLHYKTLMSRCHCMGLVLGSWTGGFLHGSIQLVFTMSVPFCGPNHVDSFFCDIPLVTRLVCADSSSLDVMMVTNSGILSLVSFVALLISYGLVISTIFSRANSVGGSKAISTCTSHLIVVTMYFGPCLFIYLRPYARFRIDKVLSVFYTCITPFLNPAVYALKNKEMKAALRKILARHSGRIARKSKLCH